MEASNVVPRASMADFSWYNLTTENEVNHAWRTRVRGCSPPTNRATAPTHALDATGLQVTPNSLLAIRLLANCRSTANLYSQFSGVDTSFRLETALGDVPVGLEQHISHLGSAGPLCDDSYHAVSHQPNIRIYDCVTLVARRSTGKLQESTSAS